MSADEDTRRLSAGGDPTGWFETLYAEADAGRAEVPWDVPEPAAHLQSAGLPNGAGRTAIVVGCGPGRDAEFVAGLGYATTAFDISPTAVRLARERHPGTTVDYRVADLLDPPPRWRRAFDLVVESNNVQALPRGLRSRAVAAVGELVAAGGTLLVLAAAAGDADGDGPPWPLTRPEIESFATGGLRPSGVTGLASPGSRLARRWRATFTR